VGKIFPEIYYTFFPISGEEEEEEEEEKEEEEGKKVTHTYTHKD
jgi:hypothetical protein